MERKEIKLSTADAVLAWAEAVPCDECGCSNMVPGVIWPARDDVAAYLSECVRLRAAFDALHTDGAACSECGARWFHEEWCNEGNTGSIKGILRNAINKGEK